MEEQLALRFVRRFELPPYRVSWREGDVTIVVEIGARCHEEHWHAALRPIPWNIGWLTRPTPLTP